MYSLHARTFDTAGSGLPDAPARTLRVVTEGDKKLWKGIGARLRAARRRQKLTLEGLVGRMDNALTFGALGHYENGRRPVPLPELLTLAKLLRTPAIQLLGLEDEMTYHDDEVRLIAAFRLLPLEDRQRYIARIEGLAKLYGDPVADERLPAVFHNVPKSKAKTR